MGDNQLICFDGAVGYMGRTIRNSLDTARQNTQLSDDTFNSSQSINYRPIGDIHDKYCQGESGGFPSPLRYLPVALSYSFMPSIFLIFLNGPHDHAIHATRHPFAAFGVFTPIAED
jgi:hypothetical protein